MLKLLRSNYSTYLDARNGARENHVWRLLFTVAVAIMIGMIQKDSSDAYTMMATGLTILTGFVFAGLFSNHALGGADLPVPTSETDRNDVNRLRHMSDNFTTRSLYFIMIAVLEIVLLSVFSLSLTLPKSILRSLTSAGERAIGVDIISLFDRLAFSLADGIMFAVVFFIFVESLYTFYRIAEDMVEIVKTRKGYYDARRH